MTRGTLQHALTTILSDELSWPREVAAAVADCAHTVAYDQGATIFHAGEPTDLLYLLLTGEVKLYYGTPTGARLLVAIKRGGCWLGFTDFQPSDREEERGQLFTAQTLSRAQVAIMSRLRVARLLQSLPGADLARIVQTHNQRWVELSCRCLTFLTLDVRGRLAHAIGELAKPFGIPDARGKRLRLRLSHEDFADLVGASRPMVSKHLKELAALEIFRKEDGRYVLLQEGALKALASASGPRTVDAERAPTQFSAKPSRRRTAAVA
jgi:CRP/FNR family cyclic AMP-dependent transcriptional regulator